jgi:hypothetical protein
MYVYTKNFSIMNNLIFYYNKRRRGGSCGSWKLNMLKKGSGIFVAEEGVFPLPPNQLLYSLDQKKTGGNVLETFQFMP